MAVVCQFKANGRAKHEGIGLVAKDMLEKAGFSGMTIRNNMSVPGNANHEMGIARMGHDPQTSVLNSFNQMHEVPNVFITDGQCMTSSSSVNPSLTYMALTDRACDYAVKEVKRLHIELLIED